MKRILPLIALSMIGCVKQKNAFEACNASIFTQTLNKPTYTLVNDTLTLSSGSKTDFFNAANGKDKTSNAPILLTEIDNSKSFTFTAKVQPNFSKTYDAGALYLYCNDNLWQKFAFEQDERGLTRIVSVRTISTSDDNNHNAINYESVYMKISSDTENIGFYYSIDGIEWQLVRIYRNEYPQQLFIGISSQSPIGEGINTQFTNIELANTAISNFRLGI